MSHFIVYIDLCIYTIFLLSQKASCVDPYYEACVPKYCGRLNITYPFYIQGLQEPYCGYPGFQLTCPNYTYPVLHIPDNDYIIQEINYRSRSLRVYNAAVLSPHQSGCFPPVRNISVEPDKFGFGSISYLTLLSNCSKLPEELLKYKTGCRGGGGWDLAVVANDTDLSDALGVCHTSTVAPVDLVDGDFGGGEYEVLLTRGFTLNWKAGDCSVCERSGGRCGFELSSYHFKCFCPDRPHAWHCRSSMSLSLPISVYRIIFSSKNVNSIIMIRILDAFTVYTDSGTAIKDTNVGASGVAEENVVVERGRDPLPPTSGKKGGRGQSKSSDALASLDGRRGHLEIAMGDVKDHVGMVEQNLQTLEDHVLEELESLKRAVGAQDELRERFTELFKSLQEQLDVVKVGMEEIGQDAAMCKRAIASGAVVTPSPRVDTPRPKEFGGKRDAKELDKYVWHMEQYFEGAGIMDEKTKFVQSADWEYETCRPRKCTTGPNIRYPFYIEDDKNDTSFCGYPGFNVACENDKPVYATSRGNYIVKDIFYEERSFRLVNDVATNNSTCLSPDSFFAFDRSSFEFGPNFVDLYLFYHCNDSFPENYTQNLIACASNATHRSYAVLNTGKNEINCSAMPCESYVAAPVEVQGGQDNQTVESIDYTKLLENGFTLEWSAAIKMAVTTLLAVFLLSRLALLHSAEEGKPKCSESFPCQKLGSFGFPFYSSHADPRCGLCKLNCDFPKIQLEEHGREYNVKRFWGPRSVEIFDEQFQSQLSDQNCDSLSNFTLPSPPSISFRIPHNLTLFKCAAEGSKDLVKLGYSSKNCTDHTFYYKRPNDPSSVPSNPPPSCKVMQLPSFPPNMLPSYPSNLFQLLTSTFIIELQVSAECQECHNRGGVCQENDQDVQCDYGKGCLHADIFVAYFNPHANRLHSSDIYFSLLALSFHILVLKTDLIFLLQNDCRKKEPQTNNSGNRYNYIIDNHLSVQYAYLDLYPLMTTTCILSAAIPGGIIILAICLAIIIMWRRRKRNSYFPSRNLSSDPSSTADLEDGSVLFGLPVFSYTQLEEATNNFDSAKELGDGGFGTVYYGKLRDGREVAVKRLYENNYKRVQQFMNEIEILTRLRHKNLVLLYGCTSQSCRELLLVYEYISNGTVADHLHGDRAKTSPLTWPVRMKIAIETASALAYLHKTDVIHRDVKTNNILLDDNFCVKVADFGLSRLFPNDVSHVSTVPQGTPGYVDPEYHQCYQLTDKSDVYSFGVVLIELVSSMPAVDISRHRHEINLANLAINRIQRGAFNELIDSCLGFESDATVERMTTCVAELAFRCLQLEKEMRPTMEDVLVALKDIQGDQTEGFDGLKIAKSPPSPESEHVVLLKNSKVPVSPDSVTDQWASSRSTTPNTSG
ncbi:hypothetical protein RJ639_036381 [Escallonia herrerae]|uniref:non-specific serine/threonine protein kinase n=1 Tax=Escallonia herrerae TaxID=1293975 RepID=A0AA88WQD9_9ASTE|nr:hypothetical protein RJ639_036381 [Escallonia herrerae]